MSERPSFSPREYLASLAALMPRAARSAWIGGIALAVGLVGTAAWAISAKRLYRSEAVVVYERGVQTGAAGEEGESSTSVGARIQDLLMSRQRIESVIKEMNLYRSIEEHKGMAEAVDEMKKRLKLVAREGYIFRVSYDSESRDLAQSVLTRMLNLVIEDEQQRRQRQAEEASKFLDVERARIETELKDKEGLLASFLTKHPELAAETVGGGANVGGGIRAADRDRAPAVSGGEIASLEVQAAQIEGELAAAGARPAGAGGTVEDPSLVAARTRAHVDLQAAQTELRDRQARFTNEHPDVKSATRRLADAEAALRRADAALKSAPRIPVAVAATGDDINSGRIAAQRRALGAIRAQIGALRSRASTRPEIPRAATSVVAIDTEWTRLTRDVHDARDRQDKLESRQFQAQLAATLATGGHSSRFVIADAPFKPIRPVAGGRFKIALIGGVGSILLALIALAIAASLDDRLYGARDVQSLAGDGFVVVIPRLTSQPNQPK